jgi:hypothetical protein
MAITNASRIADFSSGIGTAGAAIQIDNVNQRVVVGNGSPTTLEVVGIVSATSFTGHLIGNVTGTASTSTIATTAGTATTATAAATAYGLTGSPNITVNSIISNETRTITGAEKVYRTSGNTVSLAYNSSSANIGYTTNPTADVTLAVTGIPTSSDFDDYAITFAVITNSTGTARTCTTVTLNGVSKTIRWASGSLGGAISGVTTSTGHTIFSFTGINTVGSASTTANYQVFGTASGGFF